MFRSLLERVQREVSGERALETVRAVARYHRVQASPGYDAASQWMAERLERLGLAVRVDSVPGDGRTRFLGQLMPRGWACARAHAVLHDGERREWLCDYDAEKLSLVLRSAPARGRFPIVSVPDGTEPEHYEGLDVRGRVVLSAGDPHRVLELAVHERGAAGLVSWWRRLVPPVRDAFTDPDALAYTSFWWDADEPRGWGFVVSPRVAARLQGRLASGAELTLDVEIDSREFATSIPLLSAELPGESDREILVVSHLCHPQPSANDNASGVAANLETATALQTLAQRGELGRRARGVRFLWVPELTGTHAFAADPERRARLLAAINLDMVGEDQDACGSTLLLEHPPIFAASFAEELLLRIRAEAVDWVGSYSGPGHYGTHRMAEVPFGGGSDHALLVDPAVGVPCPMLIQWPDRFYHSSLDTPDKTDPRSLALAARCAATYAGFLATMGERERDWLFAAVERGAKRRLLAAVDEAEPDRAVARERLRARSALRSLLRLGVEATRIESADEALSTFARAEAPDARLAPAPADAKRARRPQRVVGGPLPFPRRLLQQAGGMSRETRERWRRIERENPALFTLGEMAWSACDGRRTLEELEYLAWLETGHRAEGGLTTFFSYTEELGLSGWAEEVECSSSEPSTAGR